MAAADVPFDVVPGRARRHRGAGLRRRAARLGAHRGRRARRRRLAAAGRGARHAGAARHRLAPAPRSPRALAEHGLAAQTPVAVTVERHAPPSSGPCEATLATLAAEAAELDGPLVRHRRRRGGPARRAVLVGVARAVRLAGAGAAHQGPGRRDERPAGRARRHRRGGADDRGRAAALAHPDGARGQGPGRRPLPVGGVHLDQRGARGVGEVRRVRAGRPRVLRREDRLRRRRPPRRRCAASASSRSWCRRPRSRRSPRPRACCRSSRRTTTCSTRWTGCCCRGPTSPPRPSPPACATAAGRSTT